MKTIIIPLFSLFILMACEGQKQKNDDSKTANEKLVEQYFAYFNKHDWIKMSNMYAETAEFKDPSLGQDIVKQTRKQTIDKYSELNKMFPNLHDQIINLYPAGENHIIVEFVSTGTASDHSTFKLPICTILTIEHGIITKDFTYFDNFDESK
jgi:hypothetical protein